MIELTILNHLNANLSGGVEAYMELPEGEDPIPCVVIEKTGSGISNRLKNATLAIQSYGTSLYKAASLNEEVKTIMEDALSLDGIGSVKLNSDYNYSDTERKRYRYQAVFDIIYEDIEE